MPGQIPDVDPEETAEWLDSFDGAVEERGRTRARHLMLALQQRAAERGVGLPVPTTTDYVNTIVPEEEPWFPGDEEVERRYRAWLRWNAAITVHRAQRPEISVGGHISSYASSATLYEVGFNHFFKGHDGGTPDQVYIQGHASPGVYARAFLEGRLSETDLDGFRQELTAKGRGLPSYPHPRLMKDFWEFPTVSMGLGPMNAIYQAQSNKYLTARGIKDVAASHVWAFLGDGEMDEPESRGLLQVAANEGLDNLTFVVNCNLQRLDGPVRGNGKIVQELESFFRGAGWNVIKVLWGREWDPLLAADRDGALVQVMNQTLDGDYQTFKAESGAYVREHFFGQDPRTRKLVEGYTDDQVWGLKRGGHDYRKVYAAYKAAVEHQGQPTVILAKTVKGYGLGSHFEARNATHQMKKLTMEDLKAFRDSLRIPITDKQLEADLYHPPYYHPGEDAEEIRYLRERRQKLGGALPSRRTTPHTRIEMPGDDAYKVVKRGSGKQTIATTMAFVRLLKDLMRDKELGRRVVPIIPDEARTFGMDSFFPTAKIYNPKGQKYQSVDRELMLSYKESESGQILHVGINEAGSVAAFTAAGTSYATHGEALIPVYVFYSMFGFQRTGDSLWAAGDQMARGFLLGATAGRTTLTGEGLQHADGHSPLLASTNPAVVSYDPAYGYEIGHIVRAGLERMYGDGPQGTDAAGHDVDPNVMYYVTVYNEPMVQPAEPEDVDAEGIVRGMHLVSAGHEGDRPRVQLLASGVGVPWALEAQELLGTEFGVDADVWSVTSWGELRRDALACDAWAFERPGAAADEAPVPYVTQRLQGRRGPVVAVSDYMRSVQEQIRPWVPGGDYTALGTDGFGLSDTRAATRRHFRVDGPSTAYAALRRLAALGEVDADAPRRAYDLWRIDDASAGTSGSAGGDA
ncbi:pyruvate dehydrogenase (acetyl-transferring), homodimeric type [Pseudokineococcus lusitanus]|uniref:Pyruvate dehydrogenase E1 component n=1 Tax=Pseudokineococcus lusitanus TaxID=763993 RepID=A0A3N1HTP9_9ACTN|nr:pyruvate dehydrogenase E1 component [Pseudokineococcus lusitanus]